MQKDGTTLHRWSFLAQAVGTTVRDLTALINVEVPESALSVYSDAVVRKALASVTFRPAPIKEQLSMLPFRFGDLAGFEVVQVMPTGTVVLADKTDEKTVSRPVMIVSVGRGGPADSTDRGRFARDLVATTPVRELSINQLSRCGLITRRAMKSGPRARIRPGNHFRWCNGYGLARAAICAL